MISDTEIDMEQEEGTFKVAQDLKSYPIIVDCKKTIDDLIDKACIILKIPKLNYVVSVYFMIFFKQ